MQASRWASSRRGGSTCRTGGRSCGRLGVSRRNISAGHQQGPIPSVCVGLKHLRGLGAPSGASTVTRSVVDPIFIDISALGMAHSWDCNDFLSELAKRFFNHLCRLRAAWGTKSRWG
eukprot:1191234-Prorocentrum_minimum.AAC.2